LVEQPLADLAPISEDGLEEEKEEREALILLVKRRRVEIEGAEDKERIGDAPSALGAKPVA